MARTNVKTSEPTRLVQTDVPQLVIVQVLDPLNVNFARWYWELTRTDAAGNPLGGFIMNNLSGPLKFDQFIGELWARSAVQTEIEVTVS